MQTWWVGSHLPPFSSSEFHHKFESNLISHQDEAIERETNELKFNLERN
jgi:hypothetical protein